MSSTSLCDCTGYTVLVTGAASGIGRATARVLASRGARVVCTDRNRERLAETMELLVPGDALSIAADLLISADVERLAAECPEVDGMVASAGVIRLYPIRAYNESRIRGLMDTNWAAPMLLLQALYKKKIRDGASLVFLSSIMSRVGTELNAVYAGSKGALAASVRCLALELAPRRIRVNAISPGFVKTPMLEQIALQTDLAPFEAKHPLGFGTAEDVANAAVFLVSRSSRWITGTNLVVDGGYSAG